jgi:GNAT superfamily N-acetyltransferase
LKNTFRIRPASSADVDKITHCVTAAYSVYLSRLGGKSPAPMLECYADVVTTRQVFVAEENGDVIGVLVLGKDDEGLLLDNVAVEPSHQRKGVGHALLQFAEAEARSQGYSEIHLYTNVVMTENQTLYAKFGYVEYARREEEGFSRVYVKKILV